MGLTVNFLSGQVVACYFYSCETYNGGEWKHLVNTIFHRYFHSSAVKENRILLIGGVFSNSTEWISLDGSPSQPGPFDVRHGDSHCTVQLSEDLVVVTGGDETGALVTSYQLTGNGDETPLAPMNQSRVDHACGVYRDAGGHQVRRLLIHLILIHSEVMKIITNKGLFINDVITRGGVKILLNWGKCPPLKHHPSRSRGISATPLDSRYSQHLCHVPCVMLIKGRSLISSSSSWTFSTSTSSFLTFSSGLRSV